MKTSRHVAPVLLAAAGVAASPALAREVQDADCGQSVTLDADFLEGVAIDRTFVTAHLNDSDALVVARGQDGLGVGVFVRRNGRWRGYGLTGAGGIRDVYQAPDGTVFAWAFEGLGSPPSGYTAFRVGAGPGQHFCTHIEPSGEINRSFGRPYTFDWRGEYFDFGGFDIDAGGSGAVVGSAQVQASAEGEPETVHYRYETRDGGRSWSAPRRVERNTPPTGVFTRLTSRDEALLADLRRSAR
ncbi:MAG TPA: hypothetical protein VEB68_08130 [Croceibacterium sp.]|nr:hypothetical protein [Croceibacterium sp.]